MSTWLKLLPLEIQGVESLIEPITEVGEGETVAGEVSDGLRRIWTLYQGVKKAADLLGIEVRYSKASDEESGKIIELMHKSRALEQIF